MEHYLVTYLVKEYDSGRGFFTPVALSQPKDHLIPIKETVRRAAVVMWECYDMFSVTYRIEQFVGGKMVEIKGFDE